MEAAASLLIPTVGRTASSSPLSDLQAMIKVLRWQTYFPSREMACCNLCSFCNKTAGIQEPVISTKWYNGFYFAIKIKVHYLIFTMRYNISIPLVSTIASMNDFLSTIYLTEQVQQMQSEKISHSKIWKLQKYQHISN